MSDDNLDIRVWSGSQKMYEVGVLLKFLLQLFKLSIHSRVMLSMSVNILAGEVICDATPTYWSFAITLK